MALKVNRLGEEEVHLNIMVYGDPGTAKTSFAAGACEHKDMRDVLFLAVEGGMLSVKELGLKNMPLVADIGNVSEVEDAFWKLAGRSKPWDKIGTVVIDSTTELVAKDLTETVTRNLPKTSRGGKQRESIDDAWLEDRGAVSQRNARLFRWFRDLPLHVIFVAHPRYEWPRSEDGVPNMSGNPVSCLPGFGPKLGQQVMGYMDMVWYFKRMDNDNIRVLTNTKGPYFAKTRGERLRNAFGQSFNWEAGDLILPAVYDTITHGKPFPFRMEPDVKAAS